MPDGGGAGLDAGPAPPAELVLRVGGRTDGGRLLAAGNVFSGTLWYPFRGAQVATDKLVAPPNQLGALRYSLASISERTGLTQAQFEAQVPGFVAQLPDLELLGRWRDGGGELIFNLYETPDWLGNPGVGPSSACAWRTDDYRFFRPPSDLVAWSNSVVRPLVTALVARFGPGQRYELWNEPTTCTWLGTTEQYMQLYEATVTAIRSVDPTARVGGPSHADSVASAGTLNDPPSPPRFVQRLVEFARSRGLPLDFVSLHAYGASPNPDFEFHEREVAAVRGWLSDAGYGAAELINDEWNHDAYFTPGDGGSVAEVVNYSAVNTVYTVQTMLAFDRAGYGNQAGQALEDTGGNVASQTFTWAHALPRPGYQAFELLSELRGVQHDVSGHPWVRATAFREGKVTRIAAASFPNRPEWSLQAAVLLLLRTDPSTAAVLTQSPDAGLAYLSGASPTPPPALTPLQQQAFSAGRTLVADDAARRQRWGVSGDPVQAIRTAGNAVGWRLELDAAPARVTHRWLDATNALSEARLRQLVAPLGASTRAAACGSAHRLLGTTQCAGIDTYCTTGSAAALANPPAACLSATAFVVNFVAALDLGAIESALVQLGESAKLPAYRAEFAVALGEYRTAWNAMWNDPLLAPKVEELPLRTTEDGGLAVSFDGLPYSVHLLTVTAP